jgi:hypothetical protein
MDIKELTSLEMPEALRLVWNVSRSTKALIIAQKASQASKRVSTTLNLLDGCSFTVRMLTAVLSV